MRQMRHVALDPAERRQLKAEGVISDAWIIGCTMTVVLGVAVVARLSDLDSEFEFFARAYATALAILLINFGVKFWQLDWVWSSVFAFLIALALFGFAWAGPTVFNTVDRNTGPNPHYLGKPKTESKQLGRPYGMAPDYIRQSDERHR